MPNSSSSDIRTYALAGAQVRLNELDEEQQQIGRLFPELRNGAASRRLVGRVSSDSEATATLSNRRRRSTMSAAQRKAVGERMKKYWAARRGGTATQNGSAYSPAAATSSGGKRRGPRTMSAEARKRISEAQKARWAKQRGEAKATDTSSTGEASATPRDGGPATSVRGAGKRGPRKMSAAARKRISQAQKKRWAAKRPSN